MIRTFIFNMETFAKRMLSFPNTVSQNWKCITGATFVPKASRQFNQDVMEIHLDCTWKFACTVDSNVKKIPALNDTSVPGKVLEWAQLYLQNVSFGYPAYSSQ